MLPLLSCGSDVLGQEVEVAITGDITFLAGFGELEDRGAGEDNEIFETDATVTIEAIVETRRPDLRYGAITELTADPTSDPGAETVFLFLRSPLGDPRFGLDDTTATSINYSAPFVAVGTGGLDGNIVDSTELVFLTATETDNVRAIYYSSFFNSFQFGVSYTPNDVDNEDEDKQFDELVEATFNYYREMDDWEIGAALSLAAAESYRGVVLSGTSGLDEFAIAGGLAAEEIGRAQRRFYNLGAAVEFEPLAMSVNGGQCIDCDEDESWNFIAGVELDLLPGAVAALELSRFRNDEDAEGNIALFSIGLEF